MVVTGAKVVASLRPGQPQPGRRVRQPHATAERAWPTATPRLGNSHPDQGAPGAPSPRHLPHTPALLPPCPLIHCHLRAASSRPRRGPQAGGVHSSEGRKPRTKLPSGLVLERASFPACRCRLAASSQPGCAGRAPASVPRKVRAHACDLIPPCLPPSRPWLPVQSHWGVRASA